MAAIAYANDASKIFGFITNTSFMAEQLETPPVVSLESVNVNSALAYILNNFNLSQSSPNTGIIVITKSKEPDSEFVRNAEKLISEGVTFTVIGISEFFSKSQWETVTSEQYLLSSFDELKEESFLSFTSLALACQLPGPSDRTSIFVMRKNRSTR